MYKTRELIKIDGNTDFYSKDTIVEIVSFIKEQPDLISFLDESPIGIEVTDNNSSYDYSTFGEFITDFSIKDTCTEFSIFYNIRGNNYFHIYASHNNIAVSLSTDLITKAQADDLIKIMFDFLTKYSEPQISDENDHKPDIQKSNQINESAKENKPWYKSGVFWTAAGAIIALIGIAISVLINVIK